MIFWCQRAEVQGSPRLQQAWTALDVESAEGGIVSACGWTFHKSGFHFCQERYILFTLGVYTSCWTHRASCPTNTGDPFLTSIEVGVNVTTRLYPLPRLELRGAVPSWRGAFLKHRYNLVVYLYLLNDYRKCYITQETRMLYFTVRLAAKCKVRKSP